MRHHFRSRDRRSRRVGFLFFADFRLPDQYIKHLHTIERDLGEVAATQRFVPLQQYVANSVDSADDSAQWDFVNAVMAIAIRPKMAPGSEDCLSDIPR
ncbi:hypothetical protein GGR53DRAFT_471365 [Hypoxylon sp. FL1150]|nr:hypothetical protein GGR53DRAFT_471365 [Hypoxylon sp. FL1150]